MSVEVGMTGFFSFAMTLAILGLTYKPRGQDVGDRYIFALFLGLLNGTLFQGNLLQSLAGTFLAIAFTKAL